MQLDLVSGEVPSAGVCFSFNNTIDRVAAWLVTAAAVHRKQAGAQGWGGLNRPYHSIKPTNGYVLDNELDTATMDLDFDSDITIVAHPNKRPHW